MAKRDYLFTSERLGFRGWLPSDLQPYSTMNADDEVMRYFPSTYTKEQCAGFMDRMIAHQEENGYCYFAVDVLDSSSFIGFIGLAYQTYEAPFTPAVDIGWRLDKNHWGNGYATEGAKACLTYAHDVLKIDEIYSVASETNTPSINVMKKIGMVYITNFDHPALLDHKSLKNCVLYAHK